MHPFLIKKGDVKVLDFNKHMIVPKGFTYKIKSISNPPHGTYQSMVLQFRMKNN